ncbi:NADP-dependent malic enzyme [Patescibacteria group bacterium]|nr:MAG: NADP-dependent malic enzyme [Patescibacteria group bacterium]
MEKVYEDSLELHRRHGGKLEVKSKVPLKNRADLSLAYTPGVAEVSRVIGADKKLAYDYTLKKNSVAVISDGSAILGLGNLGAEAALPVMEGKCALFKEFGGIDAFPLCLATQEPEEIIATVKAVAPVFGGINLEDISAPRCFGILARLREELDIPVIHDDQQGTAVVVLAALINSLRVLGREKEKVKVVINGAGAAGIAIGRMLLAYGFMDLILLDSKGVIGARRGDLSKEKFELAARTNLAGISGGLSEAIRGADIFIGVSKPGVLSGEMVRSMNQRPIVLAMANPVPEIMPGEALLAGAAIVGTGRSDFPNQVNNVLVFPGIFRGALDNRVKKITDAMLLAAAENIARSVETPDAEKILPDVFDKKVVAAVAAAIK